MYYHFNWLLTSRAVSIHSELEVHTEGTWTQDWYMACSTAAWIEHSRRLLCLWCLESSVGTGTVHDALMGHDFECGYQCFDWELDVCGCFPSLIRDVCWEAEIRGKAGVLWVLEGPIGRCWCIWMIDINRCVDE